MGEFYLIQCTLAIYHKSAASTEEVNLNAPHPPQENALEAFSNVLSTIKGEILKSRHDWDKHEPRMWSRAAGLSDAELVAFDLKEDLVAVRRFAQYTARTH